MAGLLFEFSFFLFFLLADGCLYEWLVAGLYWDVEYVFTE